MADAVLRGINWRETFAFTHIFRSFRIAIHPSKLVLGLILLLSLYLGGRVLDWFWDEDDLAVPAEVYQYEEARENGTAREFGRLRRDRRREIEDLYAFQLVGYGLAKDLDEGRRFAADAKKLDDVNAKILEARKKAVASAESDEDRILAYRAAYEEWRQAKSVEGEGIFISFFDYERTQVLQVVQGVLGGNWLGGWMGDPGPNGVLASIVNFFAVGPVWMMRHHPFYFILFAILFLTVWAIFGGAIARIAAVHVARDEKLSFRSALSFSFAKFLSFVSAPLIPLIIVGVVGLVPIIAGLLASIPYIGAIINIVMGALFVLLLAAGFIMTLVLIGLLVGFNLMYPTIAVEGSDSFDAISRSFSYIYARPWRMVFYTLVAIIYGALTYLFVRIFVGLMLGLTHYFVGLGMAAKDAPSNEPLWLVMWPGPGARLSYDIDFLTLRWNQDIAAGLVAFWVYLVIALLGAFLVSFYFSANTIIYYLLRREVDATEMDDVYLEQSEEEFGEPPAASGVPPTVAVDTAATGSGPSTGVIVPPSGEGADAIPGSARSDQTRPAEDQEE